ncbi:3-hydroxylacyl-ACP dehydratase [Lampropedia puyangensis]|uniref:3-hydroxylacyl-ACP dehydratase n=1 Tax=Lampropedia puyangensis TaxID=1330072 RepID=A0A4S8F656_9BURK|nr:3-hydroxylacyl-ACP dehydratase [Lampropedia puyangensis]THU02589.1 3-hydroxylacyl-ACP dehydratase [Lampropedia puyangensis]
MKPLSDSTLTIQTVEDIMDVRPFVPHRENMLWLDKIVHIDAQHAHAQATLKHDSMFIRDDNSIPIWVCIEYMAQTVAAWAGNQSQQQQQPAKIGYLLGTRRFNTTRHQLKTGDVLDIHAKMELQAENGLGMFTCEVVIRNQRVATANLSVFQPPESMP